MKRKVAAYVDPRVDEVIANGCAQTEVNNMKRLRIMLCLLMFSAFATIALAADAAAQVPSNVTVIATGLDGPRGLKFGPDGALYVAEAGRGGPTLSSGLSCPQVPSPVGPYHGGPTARISKITSTGQVTTVTTVVDGLPSGMTSLPSGDTVGAADVAFVGDTLFALLAGGGCSHGNPDAPNGVIRVDVVHGTWSYVADLSAFVQTHPPANPGPSLEDFEPDGTWYGMIAVRDNLYATEPNQQHIVRISPTTGQVDQLADISASSSLWIGPTGLTDHGNIFFGNLAPFPIDPGSANVFKLTPSGNFTLWRGGFTTVVGVAFDNRDRLYVLELSDAAGFPSPGAGKLLRISPTGEVQEIVTGLMVPTALTIGPDGAVYISNFGAAPAGLGQIIRVDVTE
jgi:hypothetical protein